MKLRISVIAVTTVTDVINAIAAGDNSSTLGT